MHRRTGRIGSTVAVTLAFMICLPVVAGAVPATRHGRGGAVDCRASATKLGDEITLTFWLRTKAPDRRWDFKIWQNGVRILARTRTTNAMGDVRIRVGTLNERGRDVFRFRAVNRTKTSVCGVRNLRV